MVSKSSRAVRVYSKYGVVFFYLYVFFDVIITFFSKQKKDQHGWYYDFSDGLAPDIIEVRKIKPQYSNLSNLDFEESEIKEDIYPLS